MCAHLGIALLPGGHALCPFHADEDPSFYLWDGDDGVQRWWCQPCGFGGDLFDLIGRVRGVAFPEAVTYAAGLLAQLPPGYEPPRPEPPAVRTGPGDWEGEVAGARARAAQPDHAGILAVRTGLAGLNEPALAARWDAYLRVTWGWGIATDGSVYMPHWDAAAALTGCKVRRADGRRDALPGSRFTDLYGAWLGRRHPEVLICEGETDGAWAGWAAGEERLPLDVVALPRGAGAEVEAAWLDYLRGARTVYLALDPDAAGVTATRRWLAALREVGFRDSRVCCLPLGRDLRDARPELRRLLASARRELPPPADLSTVSAALEDPERRGDEFLRGAVYGYLRVGKEGELRRVTTWEAEPVAQLTGAGEAGYDVELRTHGPARRAVLRLADLASVRDANRWCNRHGLAFTARADDLQRVTEYVQARGNVTPEVFQTERVGLHDPPPEYHFAGRSVALPDGNYLGQVPWRYAPAAAADVTGRVLLPAPGGFDWDWVVRFLELNETAVTHPLLAWTVASARRPEVREFPILFLGGSSGVGKSTLARLALRLAGSAIELDLGASTPFVLLRTLAATTSVPLLVDEWTRLSRRDAREALQGAIPILYTGGTFERGRADLGVATYRLTAPTVVAGEDTFTLDRELDRVVALNPSRAGQNHLALRRLRGQPLERFGQLLHDWLTRATDLPPLADPDAATRPEHNRAVLAGGWATLIRLLEESARYEDVPELPAVPDLSALEPPPTEERENVYELALLEGLSMRDQGGHHVAWRDASGRGTWVRFQVLIGLLKTRGIDLELPGGSRAMKAYFEERYGRLELGASETPPTGMTGLRAWLIAGHDTPEPDPRETWTP